MQTITTICRGAAQCRRLSERQASSGDSSCVSPGIRSSIAQDQGAGPGVRRAAVIALAATTRVHSDRCLATFSYAHSRGWPLRRDYLRTPELNGAVPIVGGPGVGALLTPGPVLLQAGTAFVVPTDGQ
jgi:hypothetical protein